MSRLDMVKMNLRLTDEAFDKAEIEPLIEACKKDLELAGILKERINDEQDALINRAIVLYCKAYFGYGIDTERYIQAYEFQKKSLASSIDYTRKDELENG